MLPLIQIDALIETWFLFGKQLTEYFENQNVVRWLRGWLYLKPTTDQTLDLTFVCLIKAEYYFSGRRRFR